MGGKAIRIQVTFPEEFLQKLDLLAVKRLRETAPPTQFEWFNKDPVGKALMQDIVYLGKYNHLSQAEVNKLITQRYRLAVGGIKPGRPNLTEQRAAILTKAFEEYAQLHLAKG